MVRTRTRPALALLALGLAAGTAACSPITTDLNYAPGDGVRFSLDNQVRGENLLLLSEAEGEPARLVGGLVNRTNDEVEITLSFAGGESISVSVPAASTVIMQKPDEDDEDSTVEDVILASSPAAPGSFVDTEVSTSAQGTTTLTIPVLDGLIPAYQEQLP